ncbi:MAG TPA: DUF4349 domain-containing protein [Haliangium sp.]|nr:DUF4349 domain-containing protein [Haliangium sp.]
MRRGAAWIALLAVTSACGASMPKAAAEPAPAMGSASYAEEESYMLTASSGGGAAPAQAPQAAPAQAPQAPPAPQAQLANGGDDLSAEAKAILAREQRVIEGSLEIKVERVDETAAAIRAQVEGSGGRVMDEQIGGDATARYGRVQVKIPPGTVDTFLAWIEKLGDLQSKRIQSTDVSRQLFDQVIALENLQRTLDRLRALLDRQGLTMQEILAIEQEMTRLRGEIERIKGEKRFLEHKVALATLTIDIRQREDVVLLGEAAEPKLYPGPRLSMLYLLDAEGRTRMRLGGGAVVHLDSRLNIELDVFTDPDDTGKNAVLATMGIDIYSDFLGRGRRRFLNPYLGIRSGFGYLDRSTFAFGASAGVELFKHEYVMVDLNVRAMGLAGKGGLDTGVVSGATVVFAF